MQRRKTTEKNNYPDHNIQTVCGTQHPFLDTRRDCHDYTLLCHSFKNLGNNIEKNVKKGGISEKDKVGGGAGGGEERRNSEPHAVVRQQSCKENRKEAFFDI